MQMGRLASTFIPIKQTLHPQLYQARAVYQSTRERGCLL